jgi:Domain of unknown function (DUF4136)
LEKTVKIHYRVLLVGIIGFVSLASVGQVVEPYAASDVKVNWVRGTDFSKYKTYAWGITHQQNPDQVWNQRHIDDIDAALQAKGLQKVEMTGNPSLIVSYDAGSTVEYTIQGFAKGPVTEGTLVVELVDPQTKKALWWGVAHNEVAGKTDKDVPMIHKKIMKMFEHYPPPANK